MFAAVVVVAVVVNAVVVVVVVVDVVVVVVVVVVDDITGLLACCHTPVWWSPCLRNIDHKWTQYIPFCVCVRFVYQLRRYLGTVVSTTEAKERVLIYAPCRNMGLLRIRWIPRVIHKYTARTIPFAAT